MKQPDAHGAQDAAERCGKDEEAPEAESVATEETPLLMGRRNSQCFDSETPRPQENFTPRALKRSRMFFETLFFAHANPVFATHAEVALRAAGVLWLALLPRVFQNSGLESQMSLFRIPSAMVQLMFTLDLTVGQTVCLAWGGILGSFLGSVFPWVMFGLYPRGVLVHDPLDPAFIFGIVSGSVFVVQMLWLNFEMNTKIFASFTFVWHWMGFLHPGKGSEYSNGFTIKVDGPMVQGLIATVSGSLLAIVVTLFPYPLLAARRARETAEVLVDTTGQTWLAAGRFFCADHPDPYTIAELEKYSQHMSKAMDALCGHLDNAWWEDLGWASTHRMRQMLYRLHAISEETSERLTSIVAACKVEDWCESHNTVMGRCRPYLREVTDRSHLLLAALVDLACVGKLPRGSEKAEILQDVEDLRDSMRALAAEFQAAKAAVGLPELSEALLAEHTFCFSASSYGRIAIEYAEYMCDPRFDEMWKEDDNVVWAMINGLGGIFDRSVLFDVAQINFALKNSAAILLCFFIGFHGYSKMIREFSPGIANWAAILMSRFAGSAMKKYLGRLIGVVIGLLVGEMAYAILGWCELWAYLAMGLLLFCWVSFTLFNYYHSPYYSGTFLMLAATGTKFFMQPCSSTVVDPSETIYSVIDVVYCIVVMVITDSVLSLGRPSKMAHEGMVEVWEDIQKSMTSLFDVSRSEVFCQGGAIRRKILDAENLGKEAEDEPRHWRTPWRHQVFKASVDCALKVRMDLANMEYSIFHATCLGNHRQIQTALLVDFLNLPEVKEAQKAVLKTCRNMYKLLKILVHEEDTEFPDVHDSCIKSDFCRQVMQSIDEVIEAANKAFELDKPSANRMLHEDDTARISVILLSIIGMVDSMRDFREAVIRG